MNIQAFWNWNLDPFEAARKQNAEKGEEKNHLQGINSVYIEHFTHPHILFVSVRILISYHVE